MLSCATSQVRPRVRPRGAGALCGRHQEDEEPLRGGVDRRRVTRHRRGAIVGDIQVGALCWYTVMPDNASR